MSLKPLENQEQVQQACQVLITVLSDENASTPNNLIEGVVSGKSLLRAILQGQLVLCTVEKPKAEPVPAPDDPEVPVEDDEASQEAA